LPFVEVKALHKAYGSTVAVEGVTFSIEKGTCYGLLGPNGAGKTTTIGIIAGTTNADRGEVLLDGERVGVESLQVKRRIGYVPQELALYEDLSAQDNLRFFGSLYGMSGARLKSAIESSLELAGLQDRSRELVRSYSGGMKRRLNISAALLHEPDFVILDEPTVGVDPQSRNQIFDALIALLEKGKTILYTTHYMEEVERLCDRVAIVDHGSVIADGALSDLHKLVPSCCFIEIELAEAPVARIGSLPGAISVEQNRNRLTVQVDDLTSGVPSVLSALGEGGAVVEDVRTQRASLEEVFLHLTGRTLRD
jgi:ABC-2 type transport system ATP-binding protein